MATETEQQPAVIRFPDPAVDGYHQCWYAVAMSDEVPSGQVVGKEFLNGRVVVWRGDDGAARVHSAYCRHMGADLSLGEVDGCALRCEFHHWEYGADGRCTKIPVQDHIPERARLFSFPTQERFGLIWAFNGEEPLYDLPAFPTVPTNQIVSRVFQIEPLPVPPYVILSNTHDFQHVAIMHGATMDHEPQEFDVQEHTIEFENEVHDPTLGVTQQHFKIFGTNTLTLANRTGPILLLSLFTATPINKGLTTGYTVTGTLASAPDPERIIDHGEHFARTIMEDDNPVLKTMRFRPDTPIAADRALMRWFRRAAAYPAAHPSRELIS